MNILLCLSHAIEEYDQLKLLHGLGYTVASIGGYIDPAHPHTSMRPALDIPMVPSIKDAVDGLGTPDNLGAAQARLPDAALDWADVIIYHHYLERLYGQWDRILDWKRGDSNRRVIWRSVGQSVEYNERQAQPFRAQGLERIAYSPKERNIPGYSGEDALIRFYKDPAEWYGWTGEDPVVGNITQDMPGRGEYCGLGFWLAATAGLPAKPAGPGSERLPGGIGALGYDEMRAYLRRCRAYLYTGTQPASYTLGLMEAMMTGVPVVSIGPEWMRILPYGPDLFEGHEIVSEGAEPYGHDAGQTRAYLEECLDSPAYAEANSSYVRQRAIELFGIDTIRRQWRDFLGSPARSEFSFARASETAA